MSNNQEQLHNNASRKKNTFPEGFEMQWGTDDLPKGTKRRGSAHHSSHAGSAHHSSHHRSSRSHHRTSSGRQRRSLTTSGESKSTFQELLFAGDEIKAASLDRLEKKETDELPSKENAGTVLSKDLKEEAPKNESIPDKIEEKPVETVQCEIVSDPQLLESDSEGDESPGVQADETSNAGTEESETVTVENAPQTNEGEISDNVEDPAPHDEDPAGTEDSDNDGNKSQPVKEPCMEDKKPPEKTDRQSENKKSNSEIFKRNPRQRTRTARQGDRKPWSRKKKIGVSVLCVFLALLLGGLGFVNIMLNKIGKERSDILPKADPDKKYEDIDKTDQYGVGEISLKPIKQDEVKNILLIGQDRRKGDGARKRSDSMIVATIDLTTNEIKLTSLMRDMYIPVPGYGYGMINATYLNGGMALLNETIEQNFGITIDGNVEVDFDRFVKLMDLVGPIDIDLNKDEVEYLNRGNGWHLKVGTNTMTSEQVLAYARTRYVGRSDWERTDRQRSVLTKIFNKLRTSDLPTMYRFANSAFPLFKTDLSNTEILRYVYTVMTNRMTITQSKRIPLDGTYTQEIKEETLHVLVPDLEPNAQALQKFVYGYSNVEVDESKKKEETINSAEDNVKDNAKDAGKNNEKDTAKDNTKKKKSSSLVIE